MIDWIKKHKTATICLVCLMFSMPLLIVHILFQWDSHIPWLESTAWDAGDVLAYISGFMTLLGTIILGIVTVKQSQNAQEVNKKLTEENNRLQKIMAQGLYPVVTIEEAKMTDAGLLLRNADFPSWCGEKQFTVLNIHGPKSSSLCAFDIQLNYR